MDTNIHLILDMTGSMRARKQMTIDAVNEYIQSLKDNDVAEQFKFSLSIFNSNIGVERVVDATPVEQVRSITHEQYKPQAATPLFDAIGSSTRCSRSTGQRSINSATRSRTSAPSGSDTSTCGPPTIGRSVA